MMRRALKRIQLYFVDGLIILLPFVLSLYLTWLLVTLLLRTMGFGLIFLPAQYRDVAAIRLLVSGVTLLLVLLVIWLSGLAIRTLIGRRLNMFLQSLITFLPLSRSLFRAFQQLLKLVVTRPSASYSQVVLVPFPHSRCYGFGFVTGLSNARFLPQQAEPHYRVFIPGTPNPTIGYLLFVPKKDLIFTQLTVDRTLKIVVSGGILRD